jgi:hypothetical protein
MFLSVALNFRPPIYPPFYSSAKIFQTLSRDSPAFGLTKLPASRVEASVWVVVANLLYRFTRDCFHINPCRRGNLASKHNMIVFA